VRPPGALTLDDDRCADDFLSERDRKECRLILSLSVFHRVDGRVHAATAQRAQS